MTGNGRLPALLGESPQGMRLVARHNLHAISSAMRMSLSLASGVRNALCADNVTFGSVVNL
jgi:hypothetical protein